MQYEELGTFEAGSDFACANGVCRASSNAVKNEFIRLQSNINAALKAKGKTLQIAVDGVIGPKTGDALTKVLSLAQFLTTAFGSWFGLGPDTQKIATNASELADQLKKYAASSTSGVPTGAQEAFDKGLVVSDKPFGSSSFQMSSLMWPALILVGVWYYTSKGSKGKKKK